MASGLRQRTPVSPAQHALHEMALAAAAGGQDLTAVARLTAVHARDLLGADGAAVFLWNPESGLIEPLYDSTTDELPPGIRPGEGLVGQTFKHSTPVATEDYQSHSGRLDAWAAKGIRGGLIVPLIFDGAPIGVIGIWSMRVRRFDESEIALLATFTAELAPAIESARAATEREAENRLLRRLHEVAVAATGVREKAPLAQLVVDAAVELLEADSGYLVWWYEEEAILRPLAETLTGLSSSWLLTSGEGATGMAFERREPVVVEDYSSWPKPAGFALQREAKSVLVVPLTSGDRTLGALGVIWRERRRVFPSQTAKLTSLASQMAPTMEAAELLETTASQVHGLRALHEVAVAASGVLDPTALARLMVDHARDLLQVDSAVLRWWDPAGGVLRLLASNDPHPRHQVPEVTPDKGAIGAAFRRQEPVIIDDYSSDTPSVPWAVDDRVRTAMAVPLLVGLRPVGAVAVATYSEHRYDAAQIRLLTLCAAQVAPALEAARLAEERERQSRTLRAMQQLATAASGVLEPAVLSQLTIDKARELLAADSSGLAWWDPTAHKLRFIADHLSQNLGQTRDAGQSLTGQAFQRGEPITVDDYQGWSGAVSMVKRMGYRSAMAVPLMVHDRSVGSLVVRSRARRHYNPDEVQLLSLIAAQVAPALEAARLHTDLASSERQFRSLYDAMACGVIVRNAEGVVEVNHAACQILETTREQLITVGHGWRRLREDGTDLDPQERASATAMRTRLPVRNHVVKYERAAREMWLQIDCVPVISAHGEIERLVSSFIDITAVKLGEAARRENEAKSRFLAAMSHELRTPLNSILGFAQLLQRAEFGRLDDRQTRYVDNIASSGRHLLDLVNDVLDLSKVAAGQMEIFYEDFEITALLREAVVKVRPLADNKNLDLVLQTRTRPWVHGDRRRVEQVVWNLLSNAIKFTPDGGAVHITAKVADAMVMVVVADTGIGIPSDEHERIFEEFTQVDDGRNRSHQGTGLGLPLSRRLVQLMGGTLTLVSDPGQGSTFTVTLSRARRSD
jgi:PAS domain S-box-containing protein